MRSASAASCGQVTWVLCHKARTSASARVTARSGFRRSPVIARLAGPQPRWARGRGADVLVQPEHVVRVPRPLQGGQTTVLRIAVDPPHDVVSRFHDVVDVLAGTGEGLQRIHRSAAPPDERVVQGTLVPYRLDAAPEGSASADERHRVLRNTGNGAALGHERHGTVPWRVRDAVSAGVTYLVSERGKNRILHVKALPPCQRLVLHRLHRQVAPGLQRVEQGVALPGRTKLSVPLPDSAPI